MTTCATKGPILVKGTGLIGTSIALILSSLGVKVYLEDLSPTTLALACDMGAGSAVTAEFELDPEMVIVATPPDVSAPLVAGALADYPRATVTDVASYKSSIWAELKRIVAADQLRRYVGSHPMAGKANSGAAYADKDLFFGRPWVIVPHESSAAQSVLTVRNLALDCGALPVTMNAFEHDQAVAYVSHVPQLLSSLLASRLLDASPTALELAGQGLRDVTRIAASDPKLWTAIVAGNAEPIVKVLSEVADDLNHLVEALDDFKGFDQHSGGAIGLVSQVIADGNRGVSRIPGKHGQAQRSWAELEVLVPDRPGELGRLFSEFAEINVNIEDLRLEHASGSNFGLARIQIDPGNLDYTIEELQYRGWRLSSGGTK